MDDVALARTTHVIAILLWIGDVSFVTLVAMPSIHGSNPPEERLSACHRLEERFAMQTRIWICLREAAVSG